MCTIIGVVITFMPERLALTLQIASFRSKYQLYISMLLIAAMAYYIMIFISWLVNAVKRRCFGAVHRGKRYLKHFMTPDEMAFLVEKFYNSNENRFKQNAYIQVNDGRGAGLVYNHIIYRSSNVGYFDSFPYNLNPWAYEFLNYYLMNGNIIISENLVKFDFRHKFSKER